MKRFISILVMIVVLSGLWFFVFKKNKNDVKPVREVASSVKKHSPDFNKSVANMLDAYFKMHDAFVNADTTMIKATASKFINATDSIQLSELQATDSSLLITARQNISDIKANAEPILQETTITEMRYDFSMVSENLYPLLKVIGYEGNKIYWQNCPMAFGDDKPANWLSNTAEINNPYLGKNDPKYKSGMLHCGENMDSIYLK
jgi:Cu(I)/Ag(I) efflux system membrane fusion protein